MLFVDIIQTHILTIIPNNEIFCVVSSVSPKPEAKGCWSSSIFIKFQMMQLSKNLNPLPTSHPANTTDTTWTCNKLTTKGGKTGTYICRGRGVDETQVKPIRWVSDRRGGKLDRLWGSRRQDKVYQILKKQTNNQTNYPAR